MNDLAMLVEGKNLNSLAELMQRGIRKIDTGCKSKMLSVNPEITKIVIYKRKKTLKYQEVKLILTKDVKYLGAPSMKN